MRSNTSLVSILACSKFNEQKGECSTNEKEIREMLTKTNIKFFYKRFYFDQYEFDSSPIKNYTDIIYHEIPDNLQIHNMMKLQKQ